MHPEARSTSCPSPAAPPWQTSTRRFASPSTPPACTPPRRYAQRRAPWSREAGRPACTPPASGPSRTTPRGSAGQVVARRLGPNTLRRTTRRADGSGRHELLTPSTQTTTRRAACPSRAVAGTPRRPRLTVPRSTQRALATIERLAWACRRLQRSSRTAPTGRTSAVALRRAAAAADACLRGTTTRRAARPSAARRRDPSRRPRFSGASVDPAGLSCHRVADLGVLVTSQE